MRSAMAAGAVVEPTQASDAVCAERRREPSRGVSPLAPLAVAAAVGLAANLGLLVLYYVPATRPLQGDEAYYVRLATEIAAGRPAPHRPLWPPLYAELMGRVFAVLGPGRLTMQAVQI